MALKEAAILATELDRRRRTNLLRTYRPYAKQIEFHNAKTRERLFMAGNQLGKTFAELDSAEKHRVSHRGKALAELKSEIDKVEKWLNLRLAEMMPPHPDHDQFMDNDWSEGKH